MIIWLASYPKSGNTWVRLFLDSLFLTKDRFNINNNYIRQFPLRRDFAGLTKNVNNQTEFAENCLVAQDRINLDNKIKIFKTHNAFWEFNKKFSFTNEQNTLGVIHIVRDPRNVITSILNYYHKKSYDDAFEFMKTDQMIGGSEDSNGLPTIIGSWANHYRSWKKFKKNNLLIKYENLLESPKEEFFKITNFLNYNGNFNFKDKNILESIKHCKFENFSNYENSHGFVGNPDKKQKFFNLGPKNNWQNILDNKIKEKIESEFKEEMIEIGYL